MTLATGTLIKLPPQGHVGCRTQIHRFDKRPLDQGGCPVASRYKKTYDTSRLLQYMFFVLWNLSAHSTTNFTPVKNLDSVYPKFTSRCCVSLKQSCFLNSDSPEYLSLICSCGPSISVYSVKVYLSSQTNKRNTWLEKYVTNTLNIITIFFTVSLSSFFICSVHPFLFNYAVWPCKFFPNNLRN